MKINNLALFDLDHTLLPFDSDHAWGQFLVERGVVDGLTYQQRNDEFFRQYQSGTLDAVEYLEFALGTLARFPRDQLDAMHESYMAEVVRPRILPAAKALIQRHVDAGDLVAIITATNRFVTAPIARELGAPHLIAALPEEDEAGEITGKLLGVPTSGQGKVIHLHDWLARQGLRFDSFERSYFYSDSVSDLPLLSLVSDPVATNPSAALATHAKAQGWPVLQLFQHAWGD